MDSTGQLKSSRNAALDAAKGIGILFVILWHAKIIIPRDSVLLHAAFSYFYYVVTLSAVPLFFTISLHLFFTKIDASGFPYFKKRMLRLAEVYAFWTLTQTAISLACGTEWPGFTLSYFMHGGMGLPIVGGSVFYFLFNLLLLTALAYGLSLLPRRVREPAAWGALAVSLAYLVGSPWLGKLLPNYLAAFFGYIPLAYLMNTRPGLFRRPWLLTGLWLGLGMAEMVLFKIAGIEAASPYARVSTLFGVLAVSSLCAAYPLGRPWLRWLSVHSLGIYALHLYFIGLGYLVLGQLGHPYQTWNVDIVPAIFILAETLLLTILAVALLRRTPLRRYMA